MTDPAYFRMTIEQRAECIADAWCGAKPNNRKHSETWRRIHVRALAQLREAVAQAKAEGEG